jgi:cytochrome c oxidase cbb3-type subunit 3
MMTQPASLFVIVFTLLNIAACAWLIWWTSRARPSNTPAEPQSGGVDKTGHVWDGDLEEYNNPLPRWWLGLFILTIVFALAYLVLFPGLGNFSGKNGWSQYTQYDNAVARQQEKLEERLASVKGKELHELAEDPSAMAMAKNLFGANCSTCHGSDARGAKGFPNLTDDDWLWGGTEAAVLETISNGRHGVMPAWGAALGDTGVNEVASYVMHLSGRQAPEDWVKAGKERFMTVCAACHGLDGKGNQILGAPNLTDSIWLYGSDFESIRETIANGRENQMPAHTPLLGETKVRLLAAYVLSLSNGPRSADARQNAVTSSPGYDGEQASSAAPATEPTS